MPATHVTTWTTEASRMNGPTGRRGSTLNCGTNSSTAMATAAQTTPDAMTVSTGAIPAVPSASSRPREVYHPNAPSEAMMTMKKCADQRV